MVFRLCAPSARTEETCLLDERPVRLTGGPFDCLPRCVYPRGKRCGTGECHTTLYSFTEGHRNYPTAAMTAGSGDRLKSGTAGDEPGPKGMVEPADRPWSSPVVLAWKEDESWLLFINYQRLNAVTWKNYYAYQGYMIALDALSGSIFFCILNLISGYCQVPLDQEALELSAFINRSVLCPWKVLPFSFTSATASLKSWWGRC